MTGSRWRVLKPKATDQFGGGHAGRWIAAEVGGWATEVFDTHAEALAHADRRARTIEVPLPADPDRIAPDVGWTSYGTADGSPHILRRFCTPDGEPFDLYDRYIERFALALLAHHYRGLSHES